MHKERVMIRNTIRKHCPEAHIRFDDESNITVKNILYDKQKTVMEELHETGKYVCSEYNDQEKTLYIRIWAFE
jgi:hypothetical protein